MREIFVRDSFRSKCALITGATGCVGKVLVEKLLRSCSEIKSVIILIRSKSGDDTEKRFAEFQNSAVFERVKQINPKLMLKLQPINYSMTSEHLGLSQNDIDYLSQNVNFVFHCSASVRFNEPLEDAIKVNTTGTLQLIKLMLSFDKLEAFVHVSTAYSNVHEKIVDERIYETTFNYKNTIEVIENCATPELKSLAKQVLSTFPNTYIFSKHLAERLVSDYSEAIPTVIVRPSIICPSFEEPYAGWVDNFNGIVGFLVAASTGIFRVGYGRKEVKLDLVPCDYVANTLIAAAASIAAGDNKKLRIFNCTTSNQQPITMQELFVNIKKYYMEVPLSRIFWYPSGGVTSSYTLFILKFLIFQLVPSCMLDLVIFVCRRKHWMVKLQMKIFRSIKAYEKFTNNTFEWKNNNFVLLHKLVSRGER